MNLHIAKDTWPIAAPTSLEQLTSGINNLTARVTTPGGDYILRVYPHTADPTKVAFEQAVMRELRKAPLSFAVPAPILSRSGDLVARIATPEGDRLATLVPVIPGAHPLKDSVVNAAAMGRALGELVAAMGRVQIEPRPATLTPYGALGAINPTMADPIQGLTELVIEPDQAARMAQMLTDLMAEIKIAYATLPQQIIHGDYITLNLLIEAERVTAVLDFEAVNYDLRALDLVSGIARWSGITLPPEQSAAPELAWEMIEAFGRGYVQHQPLTPAEIEALPFLLRLRRAVIFIHLAGRYLQGLSLDEHMRYGMQSAFEVDSWLTANQEELIHRAKRWAE